jgi:hypothetical protein
MSSHEHPDSNLGAIHCHHADVVSKIHALDHQVRVLQMRQDELLIEIARLKAWVDDDGKKSSWFYESKTDLKELIESKRWIQVTRHVIAWTAGAIIAAVVFWNTIWPLIEVRKE